MATILLIDDEADITATLARFFERARHQVVSAHSAAEGLAVFRHLRPDLVMLDLNLPDSSGLDVLARLQEEQAVVIMLTGQADVETAVEAMRNGAENFLTKPVELAHLGAAADRALEKARLREMNRLLAGRRGGTASSGALLGVSAAMRDIAEQIALLARSEKTTALLLGESGTGKGRVAEMIHAQSPRAARPFVEVNCASLTADSLDTELFGQERVGSNGDSGSRKMGLVEVADGGSLFLDEIADLDGTLQPKLLRVLEGKSFRRVGGTEEVRAQVRLIAATSKDLVNEVTAERFREDLYYRLSVMPITLPPLRARTREDLVQLIGAVLDDLRPQLGEAPERVADAALERLLKYAWPGNIRELRNVLERAMIMARGSAEILPG
ncbi:MAG TPA: sigma-54 dependent transcriptional regulator, partial [Gemmatimonadaceae bacterium]|nr:sigma-54 dependent transcriptional regulator [Gemmatimonadaceae bacterium]